MAGYATPSWTNGAAPALNATNMTALGQAVEIAQHPYGVCSTGASTVAKTVTVDFSGTLSLFTGLHVRVKFSNNNIAANPTLNVNSTGAKAIKSYGTTAATTWVAGQVLDFVYDGTNWMIEGVDAYTKGQSLSGATAANIYNLTGTTPATPDEALSLLTVAVSGSLKIETGGYTGDGSFGQIHPTSITFSIVPKLVIVFIANTSTVSGLVPGTNIWQSSFLWIVGQTSAPVGGGGIRITVSGKTISWYSASDAYSQLNNSGTQYLYFCIGE